MTLKEAMKKVNAWPFEPQSKVKFDHLSTFGDKRPQNGSKTRRWFQEHACDKHPKSLAWLQGAGGLGFSGFRVLSSRGSGVRGE
jgi:hypothetical protein